METRQLCAQRSERMRLVVGTPQIEHVVQPRPCKRAQHRNDERQADTPTRQATQARCDLGRAQQPEEEDHRDADSIGLDLDPEERDPDTRHHGVARRTLTNDVLWAVTTMATNPAAS